MKKILFYSGTLVVSGVIVFALFKLHFIDKTEKVSLDDKQEEERYKRRADLAVLSDKGKNENSVDIEEVGGSRASAGQKNVEHKEHVEREKEKGDKPVNIEKEKNVDMGETGQNTILAGFSRELLNTVAHSSEDEINKYLDDLVKQGSIDLAERARFAGMIFWRNFVSLQGALPCQTIRESGQLFYLEKELKTTWFNAQEMNLIIGQEVATADKIWAEIAAKCGL